MMFKKIGTWMIALAACWALASCGGGNGNPDNRTDPSNRIHMLVAKSGSLVSASPSGAATTSWTLTLKNPYPKAFWYTDRPARESGSTTLQDYVSTIWPKAYGQINPNATLHFQLTDGSGIDVVYASLSRPSYDEKSDLVSFHVEILANSVQPSAATTVNFTDVTLNVLNNAVDAKEVATYLQYGLQAALQPTAVLGQYRLVLNGVDPGMIWVDNAPGQYYDNRPVSDFVSLWPGLFGSNPPNAAVFGSTAAGDMRLYFLTLNDPVYEKSSNQVSYAVTLGPEEAKAFQTINQFVLSIDSGSFSRFPQQGKGTAYQAFGRGYDPSTANNSYIYFGSDIARKQMGSLWGTQSYLLQSCQPYCRNDLQKMKDMGINLIRVYDWDIRNDHSQFLDYAHSLNIKVIVPISNWLSRNPQYWAEQLPLYFKHGNFGNTGNGGQRDWHPAIAGVTISNELDMVEDNYQTYRTAIGLVASFLAEADRQGFSKGVRVGMPVSFGATPGNQPAWVPFDMFVNDSRLAKYKDQLMLNPNSYNSREDLFGNPSTNQSGWVQKTFARYQLPILFTEIGLSRVPHPDAPAFIKAQLQGVLEYQKNHPEQMLGAIHFQFDNKVWKQSADGAPETDSEGAYGSFRHGAVLKTMPTVQADYPGLYINEIKDNNYGSFVIDTLVPTSTYAPVIEAYK